MTALAADRPSLSPQDDLFGHVLLAESLANSMCCYPASDGLVMRLYGPWGSGKTTVLSYVRRFLDQRLDSAEAREWSEEATTSDDGVPSFLTRFCSHTRSKTMDDWAVRFPPALIRHGLSVMWIPQSVPGA